jgi:hypothetical protein
MPGARAPRPLAERGALAALFAGALAVHLATVWGAAAAAGVPASHIAVYYDGHLYLEIARSFPIPYAAKGIAYTGFAPGYPALIYLLRLLVPDALASWGALALIASVVPAALAAVAFHLLGRELGLASLWPSLAFVAINSRWLLVSATAHPEPLALCLALLCFVAHLRGRLGLACVLLALAGLTRFPALLLGPALAYDLLVRQKRRDLRTLAWLSVPPLAFVLFVAYLHLRIPSYPGIAAAHSAFWQPHVTWPFATLVATARPSFWGAGNLAFELTYLWVGLYLLSIALGLRPADAPRRFLALWVAAIVFFHASLSEIIGAWAFRRLVLLAFPAALLILWRAGGERLPRTLLAPTLAGLVAFGTWLTVRDVSDVVARQAGGHPFLVQAIARLDTDVPHWVYFGEPRTRAEEERRRRAEPRARD